MGFRFRKSVKICKGVRVNFGLRGASLSVGGKGVRYNVGTRGISTTLGIPGTGLSYTARTPSLRGIHRPPSRRTLRAAEYLDWLSRLLYRVEPDGQLVFTDSDGSPAPDWVIRRFKREYADRVKAAYLEHHQRQNEPTQNLLTIHTRYFPIRAAEEWQTIQTKGKFKAIPFTVPQPSLEDITTLVRIDVLSRHTNVAPVLGIVGLAFAGAGLAALASAASWLGVILLVLAVASVALAFRTNSLLVRRCRDEIAELSPAQLETAFQQWQAEKSAHEAGEESRRIEFEAQEDLRLARLRRLNSGDAEEMAQELEDALQSVEFPLDTEVSFRVVDATRLFLDVHLPDIEELPETKSTLLASGRASIRKKTQKELRQQYAVITHGLAFRLASLAFYILPTCSRVTVSGYTHSQPLPGAQTRDAYLFSIHVDKACYASLDISSLDPVVVFTLFEHRRQLTKTSLLKEIEPFAVN